MTNQIAQAWPQQYQDAVALTEDTPVQSAGSGILVTVTTTGTVTLTLLSGATLVVTPPVGSTIYPLQVTRAKAGTALGASYYNLVGAG